MIHIYTYRNEQVVGFGYCDAYEIRIVDRYIQNWYLDKNSNYQIEYAIVDGKYSMSLFSEAGLRLFRDLTIDKNLFYKLCCELKVAMTFDGLFIPCSDRLKACSQNTLTT